VVDIDNTLLAMNAALGSDQWFEWQEYLLDNEPESPHLVAKDFDGLLEAQDRLFALGKMRPPQTDLPDLVKKIQALEVRTLVLTSRGPDFRSYTERELLGAGYDLGESAMPTNGVPRDVFLPYDPSDLTDSGITEHEAELFHLRSPRAASYVNGVFMTSGQHKGAMLLMMLAKARTPVEAVVFVDDHGRHVNRVFDALVRRGITVAAVHYKREDNNVDRFNYGDKSRVDKQWRLLDNAVKSVFD
ncbi:MAG: DUF2608 domain-containing protein, partial [Planctomycetota bacterium]